MTSHRAAAGVAVLMLSLAVALRADDRPAALVELQTAVRQAVEKVEPAVACIRVSRSSQYRNFRHAAPGDEPGQLGEFNAVRAASETGIRNPEGSDLIKKLDLANPNIVPEYYGTGIVIDPAGLVLTNFHVVRDAVKIYVRLPDGTGSYANIHAADARSDLAVLRLIHSSSPTALPLGDGGKVRKGDVVIALANPFAAGFRDGSPSVSWGVISNVRRRVFAGTRELDYRRPFAEFGTLIQTDARLALGSSGGALVNLDGELIGMTAALAPFGGSDVVGGYAVPFDARFRRIIGFLKAGREPEYGFIGVGMDDSNGQVHLTSLVPGSPAHRAGLEGRSAGYQGDVILRVDGVPIRDKDDLYLTVGATLAGTTVVVEVQSHNLPVRRVPVRLVKMPFLDTQLTIASVRPAAVRGLRVDFASVLLQSAVAKRPDIPPGVVVKDVVPNSPAAKANLQPNRDVITHVNGKEVMTPDEFYEAAATATGPLTLRLYERPDPVTVP